MADRAPDTLELPIGALEMGEIAPPMQPRHASWGVLAEWDDPLAPRAGFRVPSGKERVDVEGRAAVEFAPGKVDERSLIAPGPWRELAIECEMQALEPEAGPTNDDWEVEVSRVGLVFRGETIRRHYFACIEGMQRLVLYRRIDQEWHELASQPVSYGGERVTLRVELDGDGICVHCPELAAELAATDWMISSGHAGFRALGHARLFRLEITCSDTQQAANERLARQRERVRIALAAEVPDAVQVDELRLPDGFSLVEATDLRLRGESDLLLRGGEGLLATNWQGNELWRLPEQVGMVKITQEPVGGVRRVYALVGAESGTQTTVRGTTSPVMLASQIVSLNAATGEELGRVDLPHDLEREQVRQYDFSCETARLASDEPGDFLIRQWRYDSGNGGRDLWAFTGDLELLWHTRVDPAYGHHYAVRLADLTGDGRPEVIAGGTTLDARGNVLALHDRVAEMEAIRGAGHYDAVAVGHFAGDGARDPVAFLVSGSAGVYVIDPLTGRTRAIHRVGHAQGQQVCRVRDDMPGMQVLVHTRWANFGTLTLFSGLGERLWSIQPAYIPVTRAVRWAADGPEHIWAAATRETLALYDGHGRMVHPLGALREAWGDRTAMEAGTSTLQRRPGAGDLMALTLDQNVLLFGPER